MSRSVWRNIPGVLVVAALASGLAAGAAYAAGGKIVLVLGDRADERNEATERGLLDGLGLSETPLAGATPASYALPGDGDYTLEVVGDGDLLTQTRDPEVVAVVCRTSSVCSQALDPAAETDVLVVATTATSTGLERGHNILRLAPSNALQARAIHRRLVAEGVGRFAVVYEPDVYAMDLYSALVAENSRGKFLEVSGTPDLAGAIPLMDHVNLDPSQKTISFAVAGSALGALGSVDALVYLGFGDGFADVIGEHPTAVWYGSDAVHQEGYDHGLGERLRVFSLRYADEPPAPDQAYLYFQAYYGRDAGAFLGQVIGQAPASRADFLDRARVVELGAAESHTGTAKGFAAAAYGDGLFDLQRFEGGLEVYEIIRVSQ